MSKLAKWDSFAEAIDKEDPPDFLTILNVFIKLLSLATLDCQSELAFISASIKPVVKVN